MNEIATIDSPYWRVPGTVPPVNTPPLPMTRAEMTARGWECCDIILVTGDAYVDHPSFGTAIIGRWLEYLGYRVGIIAQPDPKDVESFRVLGRPALCWGVTAGNLDSQLMKYTAMRKMRSDDAYTPGGKAGPRPVNASIVYTSCVRHAYKGVPVILGGVEASLRRFAYYDFWSDAVRRSLLVDAKADLIVYGMGEHALAEVAHRLRLGEALTNIRGTAEMRKTLEGITDVHELPSYEEVAPPTAEGKLAFSRMTRDIDNLTNPDLSTVLAQRHGERYLLVHPPAAPLSTAELDVIYALPFTRHPHPVYRQAIPAYEMIKDSITTHRGCYSGCSFCALGTHQGTAISSRSADNVLAEIVRLTHDPDFHGTVSDLGGPTANMYGTGCTLGRARCSGKSCLFPTLCANLRTDHGPLLSLMRAASAVPGVKHLFITSGIRCDLALSPGGKGYIEELVSSHVGGRLKIAPEHISARVLRAMRKYPPEVYRQFLAHFRSCTTRTGRPYQVVEYFISGHPGSTLADMIELAIYLRRERIAPEQVQDFYPTPLTLATAMFYTGLDPFTEKPIYVARTDREKALQRALLLCQKPEFHNKARTALRAAKRADLIGNGPNCLVPEW
ncbi:MAG: YgiQ family radical SAM protein [bacterium]